MAKSVGMARSMWRHVKRVREPSKVFQTPHGFFMCREDYKKLVAEAVANEPSPLRASILHEVHPMTFSGVPVHISETCAAYWRTERPLRNSAKRYLRRHAQRRHP